MKVSHREIVELYGVQPRHLRIFSHPNAHAGIISYENMLVFKIEHLKGLLFCDRVMVFDAQNPAVKVFISTMRYPQIRAPQIMAPALAFVETKIGQERFTLREVRCS